ncbi:MAG: alpha-glucosidase C-terminal domain-containing protein, partial [Synergistaceae bacterium]|nr:alpha-glucosidase C-terminal domain-containing protein [Synergistaceae bacterium]
EDMTTPEGKIFNAIHKMITLRDTQSVFSNSADTWLIETHNDHVLAIGRYYGEKTQKEKMLAFFNFSSQSQSFTTNEEIGGIFDYHDMMTGEKFNASEIKLEGYEFKWLLANLNF